MSKPDPDLPVMISKLLSKLPAYVEPDHETATRPRAITDAGALCIVTVGLDSRRRSSLTLLVVKCCRSRRSLGQSQAEVEALERRLAEAQDAEGRALADLRDAEQALAERCVMRVCCAHVETTHEKE